MTPRRRKKRLIEHAYEKAEAADIAQLNKDEAGPYQAIPQPGASWQPEGYSVLQPHEYERGAWPNCSRSFVQLLVSFERKGFFRLPMLSYIPGSKKN